MRLQTGREAGLLQPHVCEGSPEGPPRLSALIPSNALAGPHPHPPSAHEPGDSDARDVWVPAAVTPPCSLKERTPVLCRQIYLW